MYLNTKHPLLVDFVDLLLVLLKKIIFVVLGGVVLAGLFFGYKLFSNLKSAQTSENANVLDVSVRLPGETDIDYSERVKNVNHVSDLISSIDVLNNQIENQRSYVSDSVFMRIESEHEAITTANLVIKVDSSQSTSTDLVLLSVYKQYIISGEYLVELSDELNIDQAYIAELITASYDVSDVVVDSADSKYNDGIISIRVIGPTTELTETIMNSILKHVEAKSVELNEKKLSHSVVYTIKQSTYVVDSSTRDRQVNITNRFEVLQQQIKNYDKSLDESSTVLGLSKSDLYSYFSFNDYINSTTSNPVKSSIKYAVLGFAVGVFIVVFIVSLKYVFNSKFSTQAIFFSRFNWIKKLGVIKSATKRSKYIESLDRLSGDDNSFSFEKSNRILASNISNLISGLTSIVFTGTAEPEKIETLVKQLGIDADVKVNIFDNPDILKSFSNYDGVIVVEQRNYSDCTLISEELELISNTQTPIIGAIII